MATIDFVTPSSLGGCGAPTDGVSNCDAAIAAWLSFANTSSNQPATLTFDNANPRHYATGGNGFLVGADGSWTLDAAAGTSIDQVNTVFGGGVFPGSNSTQCGKIETALSGQNYVTLQSTADISKFAANDWVCVTGLAIQSNGYPPNFQRFEYRQITSISSRQINLDSALTYGYSSNWADLNADPPGVPVDQFTGGPATVAKMNAGWNNTVRINNLECLSTTGGNVCVRSAIFDNFSFTAAQAPGRSPTGSQSIVWKNSNISNQGSPGWEVDKQIEYLEINNSFIQNCSLQSASVTTLKITNGSTVNGLNGCAYNTIVENSKVGTLAGGSGGHGRCNSLTVTNSTVTTFSLENSYLDFGGSGGSPTFYTYIGNGVLRTPKPNPGNETAYNGSVPGFAYIWAINNAAPPNLIGGSFCVTDNWSDATFRYDQTTITDTQLKSVTGSISTAGGGTLTVTGVFGGVLGVGDTLNSSGMAASTRITSLGTGTGGTGTYGITPSQTLSSRQITAFSSSISFFGTTPPDEAWQFPFITVSATGSGHSNFTLSDAGQGTTPGFACASTPSSSAPPLPSTTQCIVFTTMM